MRDWLKEGLRHSRLRSPSPLSYIFQRDGNSIEQNHIRRIFKRVLTKTGILGMRIQDSRHTYASQLLSQGAGTVSVKEQLGRRSIQTTVDVHGHLIPSSNRGVVNRLDTPQPAQIEKP